MYLKARNTKKLETTTINGLIPFVFQMINKLYKHKNSKILPVGLQWSDFSEELQEKEI